MSARPNEPQKVVTRNVGCRSVLERMGIHGCIVQQRLIHNHRDAPEAVIDQRKYGHGTGINPKNFQK